MLDFVYTVFAFLLALSVLIAVHEFGHFWVARKMGVKVLRFSIGFGKPIWTYTAGADRTEYIVSALPLGGYVKMLDEREGEVPEEELSRAFNRQTVSKRFAIVAAGPVFNFLLAIAAYWLMFVTGVPGIKPILGEIESGSIAAQAGLMTGHEIITINGESTPTWGAVYDHVLPSALRKEPLKLTAQKNNLQSNYKLRFDLIQDDIEIEDLYTEIGLQPLRPKILPVIGELVSGSPADKAGLKSGDMITHINTQVITDWQQLVNMVRKAPGEELVFMVERNGEMNRLVINLERVETAQGDIGRIGAGVKINPELYKEMRAEHHYSPLDAIGQAVYKTWDMATLTLRILGEMLIGKASLDNISGPISIAQYAKSSVDAGLPQFLGFLAIISISLGVLNLLPIPLLDGGHLMYYCVEVLKGSPVSEQTEVLGQKIGIAIIMLLMSLAFYNDFVRVLG